MPVDEIRAEFEAAFCAETPIILSAPTGSGKSTRVPLWMSELDDGLTLVIEPRRMACRSLATFLAKQRGEQTGQTIGYSIRFDDRRSNATRVLFVTPGVALRMLAQPQWPFSCVLLDEFHERGWETDLIATLLLEKARARQTPLVFTSATLDIEQLRASFEANVLFAQGRTFPVTTRYLSQDTTHPSPHNLESRVLSAVRQIVREDDNDGEVLVFLPGKREIQACLSSLASHARDLKIQPMPVHASLPDRELAKIFSPPQSGLRRVFLSTNVAETSITLPGVTWVVDSGLARMKMHRGGQSALILSSIAQDSMDQRAGRAGRVAPGCCIRLWDEHWRPKPATAPEIERIPLDDVLLRAATCGLSGADFEQAPWISPPPEFAVQQARTHLQTLDALDEDAHITEKGHALAKLPVSAFEARLLIQAPEELAPTLADLVAILQRRASFLRPLHALNPNSRDRIKEAREELLAGCTSEVFEALRALRFGKPDTHGLRRDTWQETRRISQSLRELLQISQPMNAPLPTPEDLARGILTRIPETGFVLRPRAQKQTKKHGRKQSRSQPWANGQIEVQVDPYQPHNPQDIPEPRDMPRSGAILSCTWIGTGSRVLGRGNLLLPASFQLLADCGVGDVEMGDVALLKERGRIRIVGTSQRKLAGVTLSSEHKNLTGELLREAVARFMLERRLAVKPEPILDALHLLQLLSQWEPTLETQHWNIEKLRDIQVPEPHTYLVQTLEMLGLDEIEELSLLEPEDFLPDVSGLTGIMDFEIERIQQDFPRIWSYQDAQYQCTITPRLKRVLLEPTNKAARTLKQPPKHVLPNFRGFGIEYKQASRKIKLR